MTGGTQRVLVLWIPDWPIHAHRLEQEERREQPEQPERARQSAQPTRPSDEHGGREAPAPVALIAQHRVVACSAPARARGVRIGIREREAQLRCPEIALLPHDPEVDERRFAPVLSAVEGLVPGIDPIRPGLCAMRARGPARYYGGEPAAAEAVLGLAADLGFAEARAGLADGRFAAEQAARAQSADPGVQAPTESVRIVASEDTARFLSALPISRAAPRELCDVLTGLGIHTLGAFAAIPEDAVRQRFGTPGLEIHRTASARSTAGDPSAAVRPRPPARELAAHLSFEPPLDGADQLAFACSALAEQFVSGLREEALICTEIRIELTDDIGIRHERSWAHPQHFTGADVVNRVRWQAASLPRSAERGGAGIARVLLAPARTDRAAAHEPGLWSSDADERVHHHLSRVQSMLGHEGVVVAELSGGRLAADRQRFVPWGTTPAGGARHRPRRSDRSGPWPGHLPAPSPSTVFPSPVGAALLDGGGASVGIDDEDRLTAPPARLSVSTTPALAAVVGWSRPWPIRERWWEEEPERFRLQVQLEDGDAWLLLHRSGRWFAEGRYA
ncbi:DNA polymerase Y family protein [Leucobacter sp. CSA1]|uniref:DNA polymerase Y family protein n=1 Tax=Leucobacter chromiisoli TaxID=2796471 RepID=A0A934Q9P6_9MICO|nr:DNA polymerase Y family protein [Leucobacter chromiisoli]MBK0420368.1 DNA polymerase Y family protein [Leucobacter chromiisoli]